ncbi:VOC family protein [Streptosporangium sp. NPDC000396]|uniref:VOC family protein n=1 Tax=Streptosporangium sp. NPDC000396 TaxID=3366185 RepID=UPI003684D89E
MQNDSKIDVCAIPKPVLINIPVDDMERGLAFYQAFLGMPLARSLSYEISYHAPVSSDGILLTVNQRRFPGEPVTLYYHVADLDAVLKQIVEHGGKVTAGPYDLPLPKQLKPEFQEQFRDSPFYHGDAGDSMGSGASVADAEGNRFGLVQFNEWAHATFRLGEYATPVTAEQLVDQSIALNRKVPPPTEIFEG